MFPKWYQPPKRKTVGTVIEKVAKFYKIDIADIRGPSRKQNLVEARWVCAEVLRRRSGLSYGAIGRLLNRDHRTIMHACESVASLKKYRPTMQAALDYLLP